MTTTANYNLNKPAFNSLAWHTPLNENMDLIDALFTSLFGAFPAFEGGWLNSTSYSENDIVVDLATGTFYIVDVAHTSASSGTTFAEDRAANPTYWSVYNFGQAGISWPSGLTDGDIVYYEDSVIKRLAKGTNTDFLRLASGVPSWAAFTAAMVTDSTAVGRSVLTAADAATGLTALGLTPSANGKSLVQAANYAAMRALITPLTTNGDLWARVSGVDARLALGATNRMVLGRNSSGALGYFHQGMELVEYADLTNGGANNLGQYEFSHVFEAGYIYTLVVKRLGSTTTAWFDFIQLRNDAGTMLTATGSYYRSLWVAGGSDLNNSSAGTINMYNYSGFTGHGTNAQLDYVCTIQSAMDIGRLTTLAGRAVLTNYVAGSINVSAACSGSPAAADGHTNVQVGVTVGTMNRGEAFLYRIKEPS